jgi:hypothetical protein
LRGICGAGNVRELQNLIEAVRRDSVTGSRHLVRKSSTDEMGVCQELADWCFKPYHGIGPPRGAAAAFYGKVNYGKIKTLYAVLQPAGSRKREGVVQ